jgi:catechol 2,3-dioxygenase-like lactoylglutathione lyase family enzyme
MKLDHATIVTRNLDATRRFFEVVVGPRSGHRPAFRVHGHWLYDAKTPVIHLIDATVPAVEGRSAPRIDHIAFRITEAEEWLALVERLEAENFEFQLAQVPFADEAQLFVSLAPSVTIEFVAPLSFEARR